MAVALSGAWPETWTCSWSDLDTKEVVVGFPSPQVREESFEAIRGRGYTEVQRSA